jgi:uncharacterized protein
MPLLAACDEPREKGPVVPAGPYDAAALEAMRAEKDEALRAGDSPIPPDLRSSFTGLAYYPADPALALRVPLERFENPETVKVAATGGDVRMMTRYGRFRFEIGGIPCSLTVFKSDPSSKHLFLPFKDRTNGVETYEVGRYIDLEEQSGDEPYLLDFNLCYNPYCAYNASYTCPIVPRENDLAVAIPAGEKLPPFGGHE